MVKIFESAILCTFNNEKALVEAFSGHCALEGSLTALVGVIIASHTATAGNYIPGCYVRAQLRMLVCWCSAGDTFLCESTAGAGVGLAVKHHGVSLQPSI